MSLFILYFVSLNFDRTNDYDVALVRTVETINITWKGQTPVCLPKLGSYASTYAHRAAIVAGKVKILIACLEIQVQYLQF